MPEKPRDNPMHRLQNWRLARYGNPSGSFQTAERAEYPHLNIWLCNENKCKSYR